MKTTDRTNDVTDPARKKREIRRNTSSGGLREIRENGEQTYGLCESTLATGGGQWGCRERYMRKHLDRCETASQIERDYYKTHGKWPLKRSS